MKENMRYDEVMGHWVEVESTPKAVGLTVLLIALALSVYLLFGVVL